ncbi:MAG: hypothetical protein ACOZF2_18900 [Thermodesulfobacteriota bacterium]
MKHFASPAFWACYKNLPKSVQKLADKSFSLLKKDPYHPSLHFKRVGRFRAVRIGLFYRALGVGIPEGVLWFWLAATQTMTNLWADVQAANDEPIPPSATTWWPSPGLLNAAIAAAAMALSSVSVVINSLRLRRFGDSDKI